MVVRYSENRLFQVDDAKPHILFVRSDIPVPKTWLTPIIQKRSPRGMTAYSPIHKLSPNDCLRFAESLAENKPGRKESRCAFRERFTNYIFGHTYAQNVRIASTLVSVFNENSTPDVGESYAIVRNVDDPTDVPYHIGYVLFRDGNSRITMEADMSEPDLIYPIFDMYDMTDTFHARYKDDYKPASTIVLKKR